MLRDMFPIRGPTGPGDGGGGRQPQRPPPGLTRAGALVQAGLKRQLEKKAAEMEHVVSKLARYSATGASKSTPPRSARAL